METLNPESIIPLYYQLKELIKQRIDSGEWVYNRKIPAESELAETYEVSVGTVKKALADLVNEGVLVRKKGKGSFVKKIKFSGSWFRHLFPGEESLKAKVLAFENASGQTIQGLRPESGFQEPKYFQILLADEKKNPVALRNLYFCNQEYKLTEKPPTAYTKYTRTAFSRFRKAREEIKIEVFDSKRHPWPEPLKKESMVRLTRFSYDENEELIEIREDLFPGGKFFLTQTIE